MKKLKTDSIANELVNSSFFATRPDRTSAANTQPPMPGPETPASSTPVVPKAAPPRPVHKQSAGSSAALTPVVDRRYVRRTFDIYEDQLAYLRKASLENQLNGGEDSMNSMVREALDAFIQQRRKK